MDEAYTLITGASSGIGRETAIKLSEVSKLILHGRNNEELIHAKESCNNSDNHLIWNCDLENILNIPSSLSDFIFQNKVVVDCLIHSAGIVRVLPTRLMDFSLTKRIMDINFYSAVEIIKVLLKKKTNADNLKNIIFISSVASTVGEKGCAIYCASKGAINSLTKSLAVELAPKVRVNSILPGLIKTEMSKDYYEDDSNLARIKDKYLLGFGEPSDVVNLIEFLSSKKSKWITGQHFIVDGGRSLN